MCDDALWMEELVAVVRREGAYSAYHVTGKHLFRVVYCVELQCRLSVCAECKAQEAQGGPCVDGGA